MDVLAPPFWVPVSKEKRKKRNALPELSFEWKALCIQWVLSPSSSLFMSILEGSRSLLEFWKVAEPVSPGLSCHSVTTRHLYSLKCGVPMQFLPCQNLLNWFQVQSKLTSDFWGPFSLITDPWFFHHGGVEWHEPLISSRLNKGDCSPGILTSFNNCVRNIVSTLLTPSQRPWRENWTNWRTSLVLNGKQKHVKRSQGMHSAKKHSRELQLPRKNDDNLVRGW